MQIPSFAKKFDWPLLALVLTVLTLGLLTFYAMGPDSHSVMVRHAAFIGIGTFVMVAVSFFDYRIFKNYSLPSIAVYVLAIILLGLALASQEIRGSSAWLRFMGFQFEPSEFAKLGLLLVLAKYFSQKHIEIYRLHHILVSAVYLAIPTVLTFLQPDLGSVIVYVALWFGMLLFAGIKRKHVLAIFMVGTVVVSMGWFLVLKPYQKDRLLSFVNPYLDPQGSGYNTIQSRVTFGSGRWLGTFLTGRNETTPVLVPEPYTDFTFATYAQKFGFVGILALMALLAGIMWRLGAIASG